MPAPAAPSSGPQHSGLHTCRLAVLAFMALPALAGCGPSGRSEHLGANVGWLQDALSSRPAHTAVASTTGTVGVPVTYAQIAALPAVDAIDLYGDVAADRLAAVRSPAPEPAPDVQREEPIDLYGDVAADRLASVREPAAPTAVVTAPVPAAASEEPIDLYGDRAQEQRDAYQRELAARAPLAATPAALLSSSGTDETVDIYGEATKERMALLQNAMNQFRQPKATPPALMPDEALQSTPQRMRR